MISSTRTGSPRAALLALSIGAVMFLLLGVGDSVGWWEQEDDAEVWTILATDLFLLILGSLILWKAGGNRVGWVFVAMGLSILLSGLTAGLGQQGLVVLASLSGAFWLSWLALIGLLALWFPTGHVPGPRWRWLERLGFLSVALLFLSHLFVERICLSSGGDGCLEWIDNPIGIAGVPNLEYEASGIFILALIAIFMILALVSLVVRFRGSGTIERLQMKWFLLACAAFIVGLVTELLLGAFGRPEPPGWLSLWLSVAVAAIPVSATLAILRYRLYDIDRIISRTVSYALVVGLLVAVFSGVVTFTTSLLQVESDLAVAASTLAVAALFNPLRKRIQSWVDRRFNRSRYDTERVMEEFTGTLRDRVDPDGVVDGWVDVVSETMQPATVGVWVKDVTA